MSQNGNDINLSDYCKMKNVVNREPDKYHNGNGFNDTELLAVNVETSHDTNND